MKDSPFDTATPSELQENPDATNAEVVRLLEVGRQFVASAQESMGKHHYHDARHATASALTVLRKALTGVSYLED